MTTPDLAYDKMCVLVFLLRDDLCSWMICKRSRLERVDGVAHI